MSIDVKLLLNYLLERGQCLPPLGIINPESNVESMNEDDLTFRPTLQIDRVLGEESLVEGTFRTQVNPFDGYEIFSLSDPNFINDSVFSFSPFFPFLQSQTFSIRAR